MAVLKFKGSNGIVQTIKQIIINNTVNKDALKAEILLAAHPIGSLYWSRDNTDPSSLFGGTWVRIKDKFILAAGDNYLVGATGGEAVHTLTTEEIPSHTHGNKSLVSSTVWLYGAPGFNGSSTGILKTSGETTNVIPLSQTMSGVTAYKSIKVDASHEHNSVGSSKAHNNMPPYEVFYCWVRVSSADKTEAECEEIANNYITNHISSTLSTKSSTMSYSNNVYTWSIQTTSTQSATSYTISVNSTTGSHTTNMPEYTRGAYILYDREVTSGSLSYIGIAPEGSTSMMGTDVSGWYEYEYYNQGSLNGYYYINMVTEEIEFDK